MLPDLQAISQVSPVPKASSLPPLTPTQKIAFDKARTALTAAPVVLIEGRSGSGKTTILKALRESTGGALLTIRAVMDLSQARDPRRFEHCIHDVLMSALDAHQTVYFDDAGFLQVVGWEFYNKRRGVLQLVLRKIRDRLQEEGKRLVVSDNRYAAADQAYRESRGQTWVKSAVVVTIGAPQAADLRQILGHHLGPEALIRLDVNRLFQFVRGLGGGALTTLARAAAAQGLTAPTTDELMDILSDQVLRTNVDSAAVEQINLDGLIGVDDLIERLERTILLPLREPELARQLGLKAKHGVLLHGPPGTGKTTIGRALAHLMKGRFFMIDGDFMHDDADFYDKVDAVFQEARRNNPSVIFVDDADVILSDPSMQHFGRYLLTKLDGLEGEAAGETCVMMTAMNLHAMPKALIRSGRLEVWLETRAPDAAHRIEMMQDYFNRLAVPVDGLDLVSAGERTEGFTAADIRRLADDVLGYIALERRTDLARAPHGEYLERAISGIHRQKRLMARFGAS